MMVVILTPVDGIIRWLPRGFSCSPTNQDWLNNALNVQKFPISKLTPKRLGGGGYAHQMNVVTKRCFY